MLDCTEKQINVKSQIDNTKDSFIISIRDTGEGISQENIDKAFSQKFTTKKTGHGFGLLVCKRIIESHQGNLHIDSEVGVGTTISIEFPLTPNPKTQELELVS